MALVNHDEDDEFFGAQDDDNEGSEYLGGLPHRDSPGPIDDEFRSMTQRETQAKQEELKKVAFLNAYDEFKESKLQEGFEAGMLETFDVATEIGKLLGKTVTRRKLQQQQQQQSWPAESNDSTGSAADLMAGTVREFFAETFQKDKNGKEESCTEQLDSLKAKLETISREDSATPQALLTD